jgi:alpha-glucosidase
LTTVPRSWWRNAVGYQIYPSTFMDANGDGIGDLEGIAARLPYLRDLGVDVIWISPFYPSPMRDGGYDVADYCGIDPRFGDLASFDALVAGAHGLGLRVMADVVLNHTSSDHPWFQAARRDPQGPYRDYYIWRDPAPGGGPPNNWKSHFGGDAWTLDEASGQYWLHLFLPEQPDLNWENPRVAQEVDEILRFWVARGVDGFRVDTAQLFAKHPDLLDNPPAASTRAQAAIGSVQSWASLEHLHEVDQHHNTDVFRRWRSLLEEQRTLFIGEVYLLEAAKVARYLTGRDGLHLSFWFALVEATWDPAALRTLLEEAVAAHDEWAWALSSRDNVRAVSRFGGGERGKRRALALHTVLATLPGMLFLYQGEELALENAAIGPDAARDPVAATAGEHESSRDGARTPMPWQPGSGLGFTDSDQPWLPFGTRAPGETVAVQAADDRSWLARYRALLAARHALTDELDGAPEFPDLGPAIIAVRRADVLAVANGDDAPRRVELPAGRWTCRFDSAQRVTGDIDGSLELVAAQAVLLIRGG